MVSVEIAGQLVELLPMREMTEAAQWLVANNCPELASALWREGEALSDKEVFEEIERIGPEAPEVVRYLKRLVEGLRK